MQTNLYVTQKFIMPILRENYEELLFGVEHFKHFTNGCCPLIIKDHKPLLPLFEKSLNNTIPHLSKLLSYISEYDLKLHYQPGSKMKLSDALSRQSSHNTKDNSNTAVKCLDISVHVLEADVTYHKLEKLHITTHVMQNYGC